MTAGLRWGARGPLRGHPASTVNPLYDGLRAEVRRKRSPGSPVVQL